MTYAWSSNAGDVNYNTHGEPVKATPGSSHSYGRGARSSDLGEFLAVFDGLHGWFWRNRTAADVVITLQTRGDYEEIKQIR